MMDVLIINLAALLVVTSLMVVIARTTKASAILYAVQSVVLVLIFVVIGKTMGAHELYTWAGTALVTKGILVPLIMYFAFNKLSDPNADGSVVSPALLIAIAVLIVGLCYLVVAGVHIPVVEEHGLHSVLAVSLGHFMIGLMCIVTQRNILKQVFGYCLMENGAHLTLALLANQAPHLVEIGITTDAIFAVIMMAYMVRRIYSSIHTLNAQELTSLKG